MQQVTKLIHASPALARQLKSAAAMLGITMQEATNDAIRKYLKEVEENDTIRKGSAQTIRT